MALKIQTTGLEQYAPGGQARLKQLVVGGPGSGKTRMASYWPRPIYADCERGLASVADRQVPFVTIKNSQDMLDFLEFLKNESLKPAQFRNYDTVVIDTLDAFHRKIKDEWIQKENKQTFTGWEAWAYLNNKHQMLMTRLLNLDMNVIINVHYKDKVVKDDETGRESREIMLQLSGESADTTFNDFDLVGWLGTYWDKDSEGQRVERRGLTFKRVPDKPFLKDRLHITPPWMEITFADEDYSNLFSALEAKFSTLEQGQEVGEVPDFNDFGAAPSPSVVTPFSSGSGALPPMDPKEVPLEQHDKPTLQVIARELGVVFRGNTLKSELVALIKEKQAVKAAGDAEPASEPAPEPTPDPEPTPTPVADAPAASTPVETVETSVGTTTVDTATGELPPVEPSADDAVAALTAGLGAEVISEEPAPEAPQVPEAPAPAPVAAQAADTCEECGTDLSTQTPDYVKLAFIKYRKRLCDEHYQARKKQ